MAADVGTNSYVTAAEAGAYFGASLSAGAWAEVEDRDAALVSAARRLDQVAWRGRRSDPQQPLAWPRSGAVDADGRPIPADAIPDNVKRAQMELALAMSREDLTADTGLEAFESVKVGPLDVKLRDGRPAGSLPEHVLREIAPLLGAARGSIRLVRG